MDFKKFIQQTGT